MVCTFPLRNSRTEYNVMAVADQNLGWYGELVAWGQRRVLRSAGLPQLSNPWLLTLT